MNIEKCKIQHTNAIIIGEKKENVSFPCGYRLPRLHGLPLMFLLYATAFFHNAMWSDEDSLRRLCKC